MKHRIFTVRPTKWWHRFSPTWRQSRATLQEWLDSNQMRILVEYRSEQLGKHIDAEVAKAVLNDFYGSSPLDPITIRNFIFKRSPFPPK